MRNSCMQLSPRRDRDQRMLRSENDLEVRSQLTREERYDVQVVMVSELGAYS